MPYTAEIRRTNPSCFLFLVDQSGSMIKPFSGESGKIKAQGVADAINRLLQNLVLKCAKSEGIRDYFHVGVLGYGSKVGSAFGGKLANRRLVPISEVGTNPLRLEPRTRKIDNGSGVLVDQNFNFPLWFEPTGEGKTPMCEALGLAQQVVGEFIARFPDCYPPMVLNITDGMATDGIPLQAAAALRGMASGDGNVLLFNAHISSLPARPIEFPQKEEGLPDDFARLLFRMSSPLPEKIQAAAQNEGIRVSAASRGFVFNADLVSVIRFIDIGTKVAHTVR